MPKNHTIRPNCLKVERATIFFKSVSKRALRPAINEVALPRAAKYLRLFKLKNQESNRIRR